MNNANGKIQVSERMAKDSSGSKRAGRMEMRRLRKAMPASWGTIRHAPADVDRRTSKPQAGGLPAGELKSTLRAVSFAIRRAAPRGNKEKEKRE